MTSISANPPFKIEITPITFFDITGEEVVCEYNPASLTAFISAYLDGLEQGEVICFENDYYQVDKITDSEGLERLDRVAPTSLDSIIVNEEIPLTRLESSVGVVKVSLLPQHRKIKDEPELEREVYNAMIKYSLSKEKKIVRGGKYLCKLTVPETAFKIEEIIYKARPAQRISPNNVSVAIIQNPTTIKGVPEQISGYALTTKPRIKKRELTLDDVIGQSDLVGKMKQVVDYMQKPEKYGEWGPRSILLHGPPGNGKTYAIRILKNHLPETHVLKIGSTSLMGSFTGTTSQNIEILKESLKKIKKGIVFFDEFESIGLSRDNSSIRGDVLETVPAVLDLISEITYWQKPITVIAATNIPKQLDFAVSDRFGQKIFVGNPDQKSVEKYFQTYIQPTLPGSLEFQKIDWSVISKEIVKRKLSFRRIKEAVFSPTIRTKIFNQEEQITQEDLLKIIKETKAERFPEDLYS